MKMEHTRLAPSTWSETVFFIMLPPLDAPLLQATVFSITWVVARKTHHMTPQSFYTRFQKAFRAVKILDHCYEKELDDTEAKIIFFILFLKNTSKIMSVTVNTSLMTRLSKISRISFRVTMTQTCPKRMNTQLTVKMTKAKPLVAITSLSLTVMKPTRHQRWPPHLLTNTLNNHTIDLAQSHFVMPVRHISGINKVSARIALLNGLIVPCITLPLDHRLQRILMPCASPPKILNLKTLTHPHSILLCHHVVSTNLIPLMTLMTTVVISLVALAATLAAALVDAHPVVIGIMMTTAVVIPVGHHDFSTSPPEACFDHNIGKYRQDDGIIVTHGYRLSKHPSDFATKDLVSPSHGHSESSIPLEDADHSAWGTNPNENPFHLTGPDYQDNRNDSSCDCGEKPSKSSKPAFNIQNYTDPKTTKYSYWYHTKLDAQPPAGLVHLHVATYYCQEIALIEKEQINHNLHKQDSNHHRFLLGMSQTYRDLTSLDEPDIFDINQDQNHVLNQLIHFALKNWEARQTGYHMCQSSAINKKSPFCFIPWPWKKIKPPVYGTDYVNNICNTTNSKPTTTATRTTQKNNWLHPDNGLFSNYHDKHIGFVFFLAIK